MKNQLQSDFAQKLADAMWPGAIIELDPHEAELAGAFEEDALSEADALTGSVDLADIDGEIQQ